MAATCNNKMLIDQPHFVCQSAVARQKLTAVIKSVARATYLAEVHESSPTSRQTISVDRAKIYRCGRKAAFDLFTSARPLERFSQDRRSGSVKVGNTGRGCLQAIDRI